jgi:hypothetical protein
MWFLFAIFLWLFAPYALAVATPSWRWLLAYVVGVGGWLAYGFININTVQPRYGEEAIGLIVILPIAVSSVAGVLVRIVSLVMAARGRSKVTVSRTNLLGFGFPLAVFGSSMAWLAWSNH